MKWMKHFVAHGKPSKEEPHIIILDGHHRHKTFDVVDFAENNVITVITELPHCSPRLQSVLRFVNAVKPGEANNTLRYCRTDCTVMEQMHNCWDSRKGFASRGIWPFNEQIFF